MFPVSLGHSNAQHNHPRQPGSQIDLHSPLQLELLYQNYTDEGDSQEATTSKGRLTKAGSPARGVCRSLHQLHLRVCLAWAGDSAGRRRIPDRKYGRKGTKGEAKRKSITSLVFVVVTSSFFTGSYFMI